MAKPESAVRRRSRYEQLVYNLEHDPKVAQEVALGRRIGFYRLKGQLGTGNFSRVKLGVHVLTNGELAFESAPSGLLKGVWAGRGILVDYIMPTIKMYLH